MVGKFDNLNYKGNIMALNKNTPAPDYENGDEGSAETVALSPGERLKAAAAARAAEKEVAEPAPKSASESASRAVAPAAGTQVAKPTAMVNPLAPLKDAFFCEFDTLRSLKITNGNMVDNQTNKPLGDTVGLELLSYQDQWVVSPGVDGDEGKEHVRYSHDGVTTSKGDDVKTYLAQLLASGYPKAAVSKRTVIAGSLFDIGEKGRKALPELQDSLVQISLAPTTKSSFDRYTMDQAFKIGKGLIAADGAVRVKIECVPASKGDKDWTIGNFSRYDA